MICKYFLLVCSSSSHTLKRMCDIVNGINLDEVWFIYFSSYGSFLSWVMAIGPLFFLLLLWPPNSLFSTKQWDWSFKMSFFHSKLSKLSMLLGVKARVLTTAYMVPHDLRDLISHSLPALPLATLTSFWCSNRPSNPWSRAPASFCLENRPLALRSLTAPGLTETGPF